MKVAHNQRVHSGFDNRPIRRDKPVAIFARVHERLTRRLFDGIPASGDWDEHNIGGDCCQRGQLQLQRRCSRNTNRELRIGDELFLSDRPTC